MAAIRHIRNVHVLSLSPDDSYNGLMTNTQDKADFDWELFPFDEVNILVCGRPTQERISIGNLILGAHFFTENTQSWTCLSEKVYDKRVRVVDINCIARLDIKSMFSNVHVFPGPHAVLFVIDGTTDFADRDLRYFKEFLHKAGENIVMNTIVVVKHRYHGNEANYIQDINDNRYLEEIFQMCEKRCVLIDAFTQKSAEDWERDQRQRHRILTEVGSLVETRKTVFISEQILDQIIKQNDQKRFIFTRYLLDADENLLLTLSTKLGRKLSREIAAVLQGDTGRRYMQQEEGIATEDIQGRYRVWKIEGSRVIQQVSKMIKNHLDQRNINDALNTEMNEVVNVIRQHTELWKKYDRKADNTSTWLTGAVIVGGVVLVCLFCKNRG